MKKDLHQALVDECGIPLKTAERYVVRWTVEGAGASQGSLRALANIFDATPPGLTADDPFGSVLGALEELRLSFDELRAVVLEALLQRPGDAGGSSRRRRKP